MNYKLNTEGSSVLWQQRNQSLCVSVTVCVSFVPQHPCGNRHYRQQHQAISFSISAILN